ncbi:MAG: hypothetical protein LQ346_007066 [Caloplaca aetnensis]|nr:MAG: hypothetical protein LQ346_007066 [Caloplaca aetnensis]
MAPFDDAFIDDLLARSTTEGRLVKIPGFPDFSREQQEAVRLRYLQKDHPVSNPVEPNELRAALGALTEEDFIRASPLPEYEATPPGDEEEETREGRALEQRKRESLEKEGCPPCYPSRLEFPLEGDLGDYEGIIKYWQWESPYVLSQQLTDWENFRDWQARVRRYYVPRGTFSTYQDRIRDRRQRYQLPGDASVLADQEQQNRLQHWIEFQYYHLGLHEGDKKTLQDEQEALRLAHENTNRDIADQTDEIQVCDHRIEVQVEKMNRHDDMLRWIEQQRLAMVAEQDATVNFAQGPTEEADTQEAISHAPVRGNRKKKQQPGAVLGPKPSGITKRVLRPRNPKNPLGSGVAPVGTSGAVTQPQFLVAVLIPQKKPGHGGEATTIRRPRPRPQKAAKSQKSKGRGNQSSKRTTMSQPTRKAQKKTHRNATQATKSKNPMQTAAPLVHKTRSGRISKRPERLGFA